MAMQQGLSGKSETEGSHGDDDEHASISPSSPSNAVTLYIPQSEAEDFKIRELIDHYLNFILPKTVMPCGPSKEWFPFATRQPAFFRASMASVAAHLTVSRNQKSDYVDYFYFRGQSIALVNKAITGGYAASEDIVSTVGTLILLDTIAGMVEASKQHLNGMMQLIKLIGGINSPILSPHRRRLISRCDLSASVLLNDEPRIKFTLINSDLSAYFNQASRQTMNYARALRLRLFNFTGLQDLSDIALNIYWGLRNISESLDGIKAGTELADTHEDGLQFSDRVEFLERVTHKLWWRPTNDPNTIVFRMLGLATLVYIYTVLREMPSEMPLVKLLAMRMKEQLERSPHLNSLLATFPELMLWVLFLGGSAAETSRKPFFARQASRILLVRKTESVPDIVNASRAFLWPERISIEETGWFEEDSEDQIMSDTATNSSMALTPNSNQILERGQMFYNEEI